MPQVKFALKPKVVEGKEDGRRPGHLANVLETVEKLEIVATLIERLQQTVESPLENRVYYLNG
jgi:hypothetical protein